MNVIFKKQNGDVLPTSYRDIPNISVDELTGTIELLEYEYDCKVVAYIEN